MISSTSRVAESLPLFAAFEAFSNSTASGRIREWASRLARRLTSAYVSATPSKTNAVGPTGRYVNKVGPERILALVIDQYDIGTVFVFEGIGHSLGLSVTVALMGLLCPLSSSIASA